MRADHYVPLQLRWSRQRLRRRVLAGEGRRGRYGRDSTVGGSEGLVFAALLWWKNGNDLCACQAPVFAVFVCHSPFLSTLPRELG